MGTDAGMGMTSAFEPEAYRAKVRAVIEAEAPRRDCLEGLRAPADAAEEARLRRWYACLYERGLLGADWPEDLGGDPSHHPLMDLIVMEELIRARAPRPIDQVLLASHALVHFGSASQQARYLPRIRSGEDIWCQLFSEPGVGSDLAALATRATKVDGGWRLEGQKVWSTDADWAQMGLLLARTDADVVPQAGITAFAVPMDAPGIVVRPIREITGAAEFCEVFLDAVVVPDDAVIGEVGGGWKLANSGLASERTHVGANAIVLEMLHADLVSLARAVRLPDGRRAVDSEQVQQQLAQKWAEVTAVQALVQQTAADAVAGGGNAWDAPLCKLAYTELNVALCGVALGLTLAGEVEPGAEELVRRWQHTTLWSRALTISGGASQILTGVLAQQMLGFPRSWSRVPAKR